MEEAAVISIVNNAIKNHCENDNIKHTEILKRIEENHTQSKKFFESAAPVIEAFNNISTSGEVLSRIIMFLQNQQNLVKKQ